MSHSTFLKSFLKSPGSIGAIAPSSQALAREMVNWIKFEDAQCVVEYGPGTGAFTKAIQAELNDSTKFFAIERNPEFVTLLGQRCPDLKVYEDSVANVVEICRAAEVDQIDAVICGLPWASFPQSLQDECMEALTQVLRPGGQFVTFAYLQGLLMPAGMRFRKFLPKYFSKVEQSPMVWRNLPPAFVYRCTR